MESPGIKGQHQSEHWVSHQTILHSFYPLSFIMLKPATLLSLYASALYYAVNADVVSMDLTISNVDVSPDGVTRSYD